MHAFRPFPARPILSRVVRAAAPAPWPVLAGTAAVLVPAGCQGAPLLVGRADLAVLLAGGALLNALAVAGVLAAWQWATRRRRQRALLLREMRYFRHWSDPEGVLRKAGLIRDLNALGVEPAALEGVVLKGAALEGARLRGSTLRGADLGGSDLQGAVLDGADLFGADLSGCRLDLASLRGASLRGANLEGASLVKASLARANLHRANLVDANLQGADLSDARLARARFAEPQTGLFQQSVHPSVEDWIRERLDADGCYRPPEDEDTAEDERPRGAATA